MIFKRRRNNFNLEDIIQDLNLKPSSTKEKFENKINLRMGSRGILIISFFVTAVTGVFLFFTFKLQVLEYENYLLRANNNQFVSVPVLPTRGSILDRNGVVLAKSEKTKNEENAYERIYINKNGFGHLLGYVKYPQKDTSGVYFQNNFEGVSGLEAYYDQLLAGQVGKRLYERDAVRKTDATFIVEYPIEGKDIQTSIDADVQEYTYKKLKEFVLEKQFESGVAIIMDIETGQILTLTNYPEYDPKKMIPNTASPTERNAYIASLNSDPGKPLLNRAVSGTFAPGSTLKPVTALAALQNGLVDPVTSIYSSGRIEVPNSVDPTKKTIFRDWKAHGWVNVRTALANSSDVYFYAIGGGYEGQKGLGIDKIYEWSEAFGVNSLTGIDLGSETVGNIPNPTWKQKIFKEAWRLGDTYNSSIGQFGFLVTPIGLLRTTAAVATNGNLITPRIRIDDAEPQIKQVKLDVNDEWYKVVNEGMRMTVTVGTAKNLNTKYFEVAGKSGTAEVGVKKDRIQSWIAGYFPYKEPKYAFVFLCSMGKIHVSPTPNVLARDVFEYMYINKPELFEDVSTTTSEYIDDTLVEEEFSR